ncbi:nicotinate-nucleotide--dimethylbenzimidazole phosphoribosyltransferase [Paenibacillus baekrokdamisoli]|uniref:Nicotinate-nucleotide--dimethylbenzimidazole phosphoribosyltransferase n=1 Tax=Paenibacillus baekrokdamisoli TaxID=1712516 RepID=A0A3G9J9I7_9BACL|nr:nicotinate-nucleotide--dimethylbenzimidazole phosphoribosyltransferase [Paenibacillus baekrokdamisoli]MBB3070613.1 nicotinate-nucleotide--dimethylbenzimidazole phosphoribosyltransferase [Paenibacillus baekrokdamisoli]BBH19964.1 nicotinate-nucleotide--dimethylbenzimidazole phosphoribosyltransferase [Paenibacillus baekrokdamisoli]
MNEQVLEDLINAIKPINEQAAEEATHRLDSLTKPPGSLGKLEDIARQLAGITGEVAADLSKRAVIVMAGDHGVCEEGISAFPAEVTPQMVMNFLSGGAAVNVLARQAGAEVFCVDMGVNADLEHALLIDRKVRKGTANMAREAAMSRKEAISAIVAGVEVVAELVAKGYRMFATGEMGIGNTTASAALCTVLGGMSADEAVGLGTGIAQQRREHKVDVVNRAIALNQPSSTDAVDALAKVGGLEIAGLVGVILGAAVNRCPVVIDGFISSAAALVASVIAPQSVPYMIGSHLSHEQGHRKLLSTIGLSPMIHLDMRLGEGTGAVLGFHFIDAALLIMREMATFESAGVSRE